MIVTKTPLRISFAGGGSDLESFYSHYPGAVVATSVNKYIYITVNENFDDCIRLKYSKVEEVATVSDVEHPLLRECLRLMGISGRIEITSLADIPARGTGLGSSSAFIAGVLKALHVQVSKPHTKEDIARLACRVEIDLLGYPVGKQDHYAATYGGLNFIQFHQDGTVTVQPLHLSGQQKQELKNNFLLFYTGMTRKAADILNEQKKNHSEDEKKREVMKRMVELAYRLRDDLNNGTVSTMGAILHENWLLKKQMASGISSPQIDRWYDRALQAGAEGGKLLGAGGGGFLLFYAPPDRHPAIREALLDLRLVDFNFEEEGVTAYTIG